MNNSVYIVSPSVFFTELSEQVYVRNVDTHKNYLMSGSAYGILNVLKSAHDIESLVECLKKEYQIDDEAAFRKEIEAFVDSLVKEKVVDVVKAESANNSDHNVEAMLRHKAMALKRLWSITLELTYRCNEHCVHCYIDNPLEADEHGELALADWMRVINECSELGCMSVLVTGGEPTLHPDFLAICRHVIAKGMLLNVYTNGLHIDDAMFEAMCSLRMNSVSVSLYGGTDDFHDSITGVKGSFEKTLMNTLKFKCANKDAFIKTVVFKDHIDDYLKLKKLGKMLGIAVSPAPVITAGHSGKSNSKLMITEAEFRRLLREEESLGIRRDIAGGRDIDSPICMAGQNMLSFDPYGNVFPCNAVQEVVGNVRNSSVSAIWEKSDRLEYVRNLRLTDLSDSCATCKGIKVCTCCLGAALAENGGKLGLFQPACDQTRIRQEEWENRISSACADKSKTN